MSTHLFFFLTFAFTFCTIVAIPDENLARVLESTTRFFDGLRLEYESQPPSSELYRSIDKRISEYVNKLKKSSILSRGKRQLDQDKDIKIMNGFQRKAGLDFSHIIDVTFFVYRNESGSRWYAAALNSSGISLYLYEPSHAFSLKGFAKVKHGSRIVSHSSGGNATIFLVQRSTGDAHVFRMRQANARKLLERVQKVDTPSTTDLAIWQGMKKIYLAISSPEKISVFVWLGEHFDEIQFLKIGAHRIVAFPTGGAMHLVAVDQSRTTIFKFLLQTREFVPFQRLAGANAVTQFEIKEGHRGEYFLALAGDYSTVVYKQSKHRFVPFQEISPANKITVFHNQAAILLFLVQNRSVNVFQYDGWKFVELEAKINEIFNVRYVALGNEHFLAFEVEQSNGSSQNEAKTVESYRKNTNKTSTLYSWNLQKVIWASKETWASLREKTKLWCAETLKNVPPITVELPKLKSPLRIEQGSIETLRAHKINGVSIEKFVHKSKRMNEITSDAKRQEKLSKNYIPRLNPVFKSISAANVHINGTSSMCHAGNTVTEEKDSIMAKLRWLNNENQNLYLENATISFSKNLPCPIPAPEIDDVTVDGLVNGISFSNLTNDVLKVTGDQTFTGSPTFAELRVSNARIPLDISSNFSRQEFAALSLETDELTITSGDFLLPLNGDYGTVMTGSLIISEARIKGGVDSRGKINGTAGSELSQIINVPQPVEISDNITLNNIRVLEDFQVNDLKSNEGKSYNDIISKALPLNSSHVGVRFELRNDKVSWKNVTLRNSPYKWLPKNRPGDYLVTGHKIATQPEITLGTLAHDNLPTPRLPLRMCGVGAISKDIWESNLVVGEATAKSVKARNLFNGSELTRIYLDSVDSVENIPWRWKNLTGQIKVKDAQIDRVHGVEFSGLKNSLAKWMIEPTRLRGPIQWDNLKAHEIITSGKFHIPLPLQIQNLQSEGNLYVGTLNGINMEEFLKNSVKLGENLSLTNITFAGGLDVKEIHASETSFSLQEDFSTANLGSKEILGAFESERLAVPNLLDIPPSNKPINVIAHGHVQFSKEPNITKINSKILDELYNEILLTDKPINISADFVEFKNVTFESDLTILQSFDTPNLGAWFDLESRLLSKTKSQIIDVEAFFASITAPKIVGSSKSHLRSNVSWLYDLEYNSLKNNAPQTSTNGWNFEELIVTGSYDFRGRINGLDFSSDIVRNDVKKNIVRGQKTFGNLKARNINGLKFGKFARNSLRKNNGDQTIVVKGWKTFRTVEMRNLRVEGRVMGKKIENSLLKSGKQILQGPKVLRGSLTSPSIVTDRLVNGKNLTNFVEQQLKKNSSLSSQIIKTPIFLDDQLTIFGNVTINGLYNGVELKNIKNVTEKLGFMKKRISELVNFSEGIEMAIDDRALYWESLELVATNTESRLISDVTSTEKTYFVDLGHCEIVEFSLFCDQATIFQPVLIIPSESRVLDAQVIDFAGVPLVVYVTSDPDGGIFVYRYDPVARNFFKFADLYVPGIIGGSFTTTIEPLWIGLRLRDHLMILRYEIGSNFQEWIIPGDGQFSMSSTPSNELLIFRYDGVWKLGGLAGPRKVLDSKLDGKIDAFTFGSDYYVRLTDKNITRLLKSRWIGN